MNDSAGTDIAPGSTSGLSKDAGSWRNRGPRNNPVSVRREAELLWQTVVVIGGSAGIGPETARPSSR
jgi:hypothetical protein